MVALVWVINRCFLYRFRVGVVFEVSVGYMEHKSMLKIEIGCIIAAITHLLVDPRNEGVSHLSLS